MNELEKLFGSNEHPEQFEEQLEYCTRCEKNKPVKEMHAPEICNDCNESENDAVYDMKKDKEPTKAEVEEMLSLAPWNNPCSCGAERW